MITMAERTGTVAVCDRSTVSGMSVQWILRTLIYRICRSAQHNIVAQVTPVPLRKRWQQLDSGERCISCMCCLYERTVVSDKLIEDSECKLFHRGCLPLIDV